MSNGVLGRVILATDAGGTMTDAVVVDEAGRVYIGKALTNRAAEWESYLEAFSSAAAEAGSTLADIHRAAIIDTYTGTLFLNTILERKGRRVGIIATKGQEHMYLHERGHSWLGLGWEDILHHKLHHHVGPEMFKLSSALVKGVSERVACGSYFMTSEPGRVVCPLNEGEVRKAVEELLDAGAEAIVIVFLFSYLNPIHELRAKEIAYEVIHNKVGDASIPVIVSSEVSPVMKEVQRLKSCLMEASAGDLVREGLFSVEKAAQDHGFQGQLTTLTSYGSTVNIRHPRIFETIISGPTGGLIAARMIGGLINEPNVVTADIGGTSFDVGIIENNQIRLRREPDFAQSRLALPMVQIDSIGSGAGSVVKVDPVFKHITVGPESAGADVGVCFRYGDPTVSDCNVVLGYLNPDYFLGGAVKLNRAAAEEAIRERVAKPLGLSTYEAAAGVIEVLHENLNQHLIASLRARGANPADFVLFMYGGAGPLHLWGIKVPFKRMITFPFAAAFSAFGVAASDHSKRLHRGVSLIIPPGAGRESKREVAAQLESVYTSLEEQARAELRSEGIPEVAWTVYGASMRYLGLLEVLDVNFRFGKVNTAEDLDQALAQFEEEFGRIYGEGARYPESGFFISEAFVEVFAAKPKPKIQRYTQLHEQPPVNAVKGRREAWWQGQWHVFTIYEMDELEPGNVIMGPAILEHPMTTLVVPPGYRVRFEEHRFIEFYPPH